MIVTNYDFEKISPKELSRWIARMAVNLSLQANWEEECADLVEWEKLTDREKGLIEAQVNKMTNRLLKTIGD